MNELIVKLANEATTVVEGWSDENGTTRYYEFNKEKFARLIIDECIKIGHETSNKIFALSKAPGDMFEYKSHGAEDVVDNIKEHFEV